MSRKIENSRGGEKANMKKGMKRLIPLILAVVLLLSQNITSFALWDGLYANGKYLGHETIASTATGTIFQIFQLEKGESSVMPLESFENDPEK